MYYRALLEEKGVTSSSRWSKQRDAMSNDARYKALDRSARDRIFKAYVAETEVLAIESSCALAFCLDSGAKSYSGCGPTTGRLASVMQLEQEPILPIVTWQSPVPCEACV